MHSSVFRLSVLLQLTISLILMSCTSDKTVISKVHFSGVEQLFDLVHTLKEENPDYKEIRQKLAGLSGEKQQEYINQLIEKNKSNPVINEKIAHLLETPAYRLYYEQFSNMTPEKHTEILCALPFTAINSPAGISDHLFDLTDHIEIVQTWYNHLNKNINLDTAYYRALQFLPEGAYEIPEVYFIYDGNGGAFARGDKVCFDLFGVCLSDADPEFRYTKIGECVDGNEFNMVLAHEMHHVFAFPFYNKAFGGKGDNWEDQQLLNLNERIVSEGTALRCNPYDEFEQGIKEDSITLTFWIAQFNDMRMKLKEGEIDEEAYWAWYRDTYHETAYELLREELARTVNPEDIEKTYQKALAKRPSMVYTLGWWMVGKISHDGEDKEAIKELVIYPETLYEKYNDAIKDYPDEYKIVI